MNFKGNVTLHAHKCGRSAQRAAHYVCAMSSCGATVSSGFDVCKVLFSRADSRVRLPSSRCVCILRAHTTELISCINPV